MDKKINLIPQDLLVPNSVAKASKTIKKLSTMLAFILPVIILIGALLFGYFYVDYKKTNNLLQQAKQEVVNLEKIEMRLVVIKDRLTKISKISSQKESQNSLQKYTEIKDVVGDYPGLEMKEANVLSERIEISLASDDKALLIDCLNKLSNLDGFSSIVMTSLSFNPKSGLLLNMIYEI